MVKITELYLQSFGRFEDFKLTLTPGLNLIYGENEAGKSTIQTFLRVMFYGISSGRKRTAGLRERERIQPWNGGVARGVVHLEHDGRMLEIRRHFGRTAAGDMVEVLDLCTGEPLREYIPNRLGEQLFGLGEEAFDNTLWIQQGGVALDGRVEELNRRLMNLAHSGEEQVSVQHAIAELEKQERKWKAKDKRSAPGEIDRLLEQREQCLRERYQLQLAIGQREEAQKRLEEKRKQLLYMRAQVQEAEELCGQWEQWSQLMQRQKKLQQLQEIEEQRQSILCAPGYKQMEHCGRQEIKVIENLHKRLEGLDTEQVFGYDKIEMDMEHQRLTRWKKMKYFFMSMGAVALAVGFATWKISQQTTIMGIFGVLALLSVGVGVGLRRIECKKQRELDEAVQAQRTDREAFLQKQKELKLELGQHLIKFGCKTMEEFYQRREEHMRNKAAAEAYEHSFQAVLGDEDYDVLLDQCQALASRPKAAGMTESPVQQLAELQREEMKLVSDVRNMENEMSYVYEIKKNPADFDVRMQTIEEDLAFAERENHAVQLAKEVLMQAYGQWKSDFTLHLNESLSRYLGKLTEGKYQHVRVDERFYMRLDVGDQGLREWEYFSRGTWEQMYLAMRLALADLIADGQPLFLDDLLMAYDDGRQKAAFSLLQKLGQQRQILWFSCHGRDVQAAHSGGTAVQRIG